MAHHKSAKKMIRKIKKRTLRNKMYKSRMKTMIKKFLAVLKNSDTTFEEAKKAFIVAQSTIARVAQKGVIKKNNASRKISKLAKKLYLRFQEEVKNITNLTDSSKSLENKTNSTIKEQNENSTLQNPLKTEQTTDSKEEE